MGGHSGVGMFYWEGSYELREEKKVVKVEGETYPSRVRAPLLLFGSFSTLVLDIF